RKITKVTTMAVSARVGRVARPLNDWPTHSASPVLETMAAKLRPLPNSRMTPQGTLTAVSQFIRKLRLSAPDGIRNTARAPMTAMAVSDRLASPGISFNNGLVIQATATTAKVISVRRSGVDMAL